MKYCDSEPTLIIPMLSSDFKEFLALLNSSEVEYLVVGGYALAAHGHPRYTGDIDIWLNPTTANIENLMKALAAFGLGSWVSCPTI